MASMAMIPFYEEFTSDYPAFLFLSVHVDEIKVIFFPSLLNIVVILCLGLVSLIKCF